MDKGNPEVKTLLAMYEKLILKSWSDQEFKKELISNPALAIEKEFKIKVPGFMNFKVIQETADTRYIVLPYKADEEDKPLRDEELEQVAGGSSKTICSQDCGGW
ncbi:MAG: NHLP leader peptide family RiPP precursor [Candidatus Riflebacteria bacterium]|nr:NHLP leader peptide family RiPP precursor [Candidatus Riflebacteria bacterium]